MADRQPSGGHLSHFWTYLFVVLEVMVSTVNGLKCLYNELGEWHGDAPSTGDGSLFDSCSTSEVTFLRGK